MIAGAGGPSLLAVVTLQAQLLAPATAPRPADQAPAAPPASGNAAPATGGGARLAPETSIQAQAQRSDTDGKQETGSEPGAGRQDPAAAAQEEGADGLTPAEERVVQALQRRDAEVRRHEQAHAAAGGPYASAPQYEYTVGPDGRRYATGGQVKIDAGGVSGSPEATITKLQAVKRAALAPANPSPQDRRVAAQADQGIAQARADLRQEQAQEAKQEREEAAAAEAAEESAPVGADPQASVASSAAGQPSEVSQAAATAKPGSRLDVVV